MSDKLFARYPQYSAMKLSPIIMHRCEEKTAELLPKTSTNAQMQTQMAVHVNTNDFDPRAVNALLARRKRFAGEPFLRDARLGRWPYGEKHAYSEGKLIMRTDAVAMYFVHYVTVIETNDLGKKLYRGTLHLPLSRAAVLHYRQPASESGVIWGTRIPFNESMQARACANRFHTLQYMGPGPHRGFNRSHMHTKPADRHPVRPPEVVPGSETDTEALADPDPDPDGRLMAIDVTDTMLQKLHENIRMRLSG
jgi:hypothetical protein